MGELTDYNDKARQTANMLESEGCLEAAECLRDITKGLEKVESLLIKK